MKKSLILKFMLLIVALITSVIGLSTVSFYYGSKRVIDKAITEQLVLLVDMTSQRIQFWFKDREQDLLSWGGQQNYQTALDDTYIGRAARESASARLRHLQKNYPYYESINLADMSGLIISSSEDGLATHMNISGQEFFRRSSAGESFISSVVKSPLSQRNVLVVSVPILKSGVTQGVFFGLIDAEAFTELFITPIKIGKTGYAYVVDGNGLAIAHPDKTNINSVNIGRFPWGREILRRHQGYLNYTYDGTEKVVCFKQNPFLGWIVGVGVGVNEIFQPIHELRTLNVVIAFLLIVFAILSIAVLYRRYIARPMSVLMTGIAHLGRGGLDNKIELKADDEFGRLASAFNQMIDDLKEVTVSRDDLVKEIAERKKAEAELKAVQAQLIQSGKLASIGQLAAGVAHEINNPTGFVMSNLNVLEGYLADLQRLLEKYLELEGFIVERKESEAARTVLELSQIKEAIRLSYMLSDLPKLTAESYEGTRRIQKIVSDLSTFAHKDEERMVHCDIHEIIETSLSIIQNEIRYKADVQKEYGCLPSVKCYPQMLGQVFLNMCLNAVQAMEGKGVITIRTAHRDGKVFISIIDNGCGMSAEVQAHLFEPFFTTKPVGKGVGLGLSLAYNIIKKHDGVIQVTSKPGEGSVFTIVLPSGEDLRPQND